MVVTTGDKLQSFYDGIADAAGSASLQSETMLDNLQGDLTKLGSAYSDLEITIYNGASGPMRRVVQDITDEMLPAINALAQGADGAEQQVGAAFGNLASRLLTELTGLQPTAASIAANVATTLVKQLPTVLQGLGEAGYAVFEEIARMLPDAIPFIKKSIASLIPLISTLLTDGIPDLIVQIEEIASILLNQLLDVLGVNIPDIVILVCSLLERGIPTLTRAASSLLMAIVNALPLLIRTLSQRLPQLIQVILGVLTSANKDLFECATSMFLVLLYVGECGLGLREDSPKGWCQFINYQLGRPTEVI